MAQIRITNQLAKELKIRVNAIPKITFHPLDDWIGDIFRANRKKIAIFTHVRTLISFIFPCAEIGGVKNVLEWLPIELLRYLRVGGFEAFEHSTLDLFKQPPAFTKTENRKVLGHMNDMRNQVLYSRYLARFDWDVISEELKGNIVHIQGDFYTTPKALLKEMLKGS